MGVSYVDNGWGGGEHVKQRQDQVSKLGGKENCNSPSVVKGTGERDVDRMTRDHTREAFRG